ncbi:hypothetical protein M5689_001283 [Euphorbia peplus]|nr:hypothetical protein M5689_001283 [Euphorbia peplus]
MGKSGTVVDESCANVTDCEIKGIFPRSMTKWMSGACRDGAFVGRTLEVLEWTLTSDATGSSDGAATR